MPDFPPRIIVFFFLCEVPFFLFFFVTAANQRKCSSYHAFTCRGSYFYVSRLFSCVFRLLSYAFFFFLSFLFHLTALHHLCTAAALYNRRTKRPGASAFFFFILPCEGDVNDLFLRFFLTLLSFHIFPHKYIYIYMYIYVFIYSILVFEYCYFITCRTIRRKKKKNASLWGSKKKKKEEAPGRSVSGNGGHTIKHGGKKKKLGE